MVDSDSSSEEVAHVGDLRQRLVRSCVSNPSSALPHAKVKIKGLTLQPRKTPFNRDMDLALLLRRAQIRIRHAPGILLALLLAERKHHDRQQLRLLEQADEVDPQRRVAALASASATAAASSSRHAARCDGASGGASAAVLPASSRRRTTSAWSAASGAAASGWGDAGCFAILVLLALDRLDCFAVPISNLSVLVHQAVRRRSAPGREELALGVDDLVEVLGGVEEVLERDGPLRGRDDVDVLLLRAPDPVGELFCVGYGGGEEDDVDVVREHDDHFFPDDAALSD